MSQLTDSLNQIKTWLEENFPQAAESITPGLTLLEIESKIENLPFSLPEEFYELYQWSRGNDIGPLIKYSCILDPYGGTSLSNLEIAIEKFPDFEDEEFEECAVNYIGKPLFPIFQTDLDCLCVIGNWEDKNSSPMFFVSDIHETSHAYLSLTSMMKTVIELLEANAFDFNQGYLKWNEEKYTEIYLKHNSNILELSVNKLQQHLLITEPNSVAEEQAKDTFENDIHNLDAKRLNLTSRQLDSKIVEPLIIALEDEDKRVRNLVKWGLEELEYDFE
ncbi:MAG: SMI1/KNR4 family protein [Cyanobacteria bacterium P01_A01_bin.68]